MGCSKGTGIDQCDLGFHACPIGSTVRLHIHSVIESKLGMGVSKRFEGGRAAHRYKNGHVNLMAQIVLCGDGASDGKENSHLLVFNLITGRPSTPFKLIYYVGHPVLHVRDFPHNITAFSFRDPGM